MNTTLILDAACDLPRQVIEDNPVRIIPLRLNAAGSELTDHRDPDHTLSTYQDGLIDPFVHVGHQQRRRRFELSPPDAGAIRSAISEGRGQGHDILVQTGSAQHSPDHNTVKALLEDEGLTAHARLMDSRTLFAGQGLVAAHTLGLARKGAEGTELRRKAQQVAGQTACFMVPTDIQYANDREVQYGREPLLRTERLFSSAPRDTAVIAAYDNQTFLVAQYEYHHQAVNASIRRAIRQFEQQPASPYVCVSYAGDLRELDHFDDMQHLRDLHKDRKIRLMISTMGLSGATYLGVGGFSVAVSGIRVQGDVWS